MNYRTIVILMLLCAVGIAAAVCVGSCGPASTGLKVQDNSGKMNLAAARRKIAWQKMNKWRSINRQWIENGKIAPKR